jgi:hypothetical protein
MRPSLSGYLVSKERLHGDPELRFAAIVHDARDGAEFSVADPGLALRPRLDVAHPVALSRSATG